MINLSNFLDEGYSATRSNHWPTYDGKVLDRSKFMTSSEANRCPRQIKYRQMTGSDSFPNWGYAERGNIIEEWAVKMFRASGLDVRFAGKEQVSFYDQHQSGTPDGLVFVKGGVLVLEIKSVDPRTNYSYLPKVDHIAQVQQNMDLVEHCLQERVLGSMLLYIDASNLQKRQQYNVEPDGEMQARLEEKSHRIADAGSPVDLPSEGMFTGGCDTCEFQRQCSALVAGDLKGLERASHVFKS